MRLAQHAEESYYRILGEPASFEFGLAILSNELPLVPEANQVRDISQAGGTLPEEMVRLVDEAFATRGLVCRQWYFAGGNAASLQPVLASHGYALHRGHLWTLQQAQPLSERNDLMVIPSRAGMLRLAELVAADRRAQGQTGEAAAQAADAAIRHLDDVHVDGLLALESDGAPVGSLNLVTAGEIGLIMDFFVRTDRLRRRIGATLLERAIELAGRSRMKRLCLFCDAANAPARALYAAAGFAEVAPVERMIQDPGSAARRL